MSMASVRPLFERFPALRGELPFAPYAELPTPVEPLHGLEDAWIKRDDLTHPRYGGNKVRKLEFVLGEIRARGARHVYTFGATGTNAGLATALMCAEERIGCTVFLFDQPDSPTVRRNYAAMQALGARLIHCGSLLKAVLAFSLHPARLSRRTYFLYAGCSNPVATFGYVNAAFELADQIRAGQCPEPAQIYVPVGSSSTLAGLTLGCRLAGMNSEVVGVRVAPSHVGPFAACTPAVAVGQMRSALARIQCAVPEVRGLEAPPVRLDERWYGAGYGAATPEAVAAIEVFHQQGIKLEQTYTGKVAAAFLAARSEARGPLLFWNTFNSRPLEHLLPVVQAAGPAGGAGHVSCLPE